MHITVTGYYTQLCMMVRHGHWPQGKHLLLMVLCDVLAVCESQSELILIHQTIPTEGSTV